MQALVTDKETAILEATLDLIAERGFHDTPVSLIARRSQVSAGIIYHYFENKDALIHALYKRIKAQMSAAYTVGDPYTLPYPDHFLQLWQNAFAFFATHPRETLFLEQYESSPYRKAWHIEDADEHMLALFSMIQQDVQQGYIRALPLEVMSEMTVGVALRLAKLQIMGILQLEEALLQEIAEGCLRAIALP